MYKKLKFAVLIVAGLALFTGAARADLITSTPTGSTDSAGGAVSASADFSISGNTLTIDLTNLEPSQKDAGQLLTDLFFTLSSGTATLTGQTGDLITIGSGGTVTDLGTSTLGWGFGAATVNSTSGYELCVICQGGVTASATPSEGIVGPGPYTSSNQSIAGNGPHNPFVNQTATFTFTLSPGVTLDDIGGVIFSFGTTPGDNVPAPEPSGLALLAMGIVALFALGWRKRAAA